jgi:hypothetical protein
MNLVMKLAVIALCASLPTLTTAEAAKAKKGSNKRDQMSAEQKKELRRKGREWCIKNHAKGNSTIERIEIMENGSIRCWFYS